MSEAAAWWWAQIAKLAVSAIGGGIVYAVTGTLTFWAWFGIVALIVFLGVLVIVHVDD